MNSNDIAKFFEKKATFNQDIVKINFQDREATYGLFIKDDDYQYLKEKNFWRIVPQQQVGAYQQSKNSSLAKIFNGAVFSKLTTYSDSFE